MNRHIKFVAGFAMSLTLLFANLGVASAHNWANWHWNKTGTQIVIKGYNTAANFTAADNAINDAWSKVSILYNYKVNAHTDVSIFDGYYGATGWAGLASIESSSWDWSSFSSSHIEHAHARYNRSYPTSQGYIQGIFCQEIFHTYGFDHSNTGDCMGLGYYNSDRFVLGSHNNTDFYNRYRNH